ncbi:MAG: M20 family metallopeptidase [Chloroflexi bacterium]|nr:M20 family metallopeptidase [Chloroflexota bacterium]
MANDLKQRTVEVVDELGELLISISDEIHRNPEVGFREFKAASLLTRTLRDRGFLIDEGVASMETAFVARFDSRAPGPVIAFLAEYDALEGLGHACGHNLIAASALGAGIAAASALSELDGSILVIGTPAEESGGGKVLMVEAGVFEQVDVALMVHPSTESGTFKPSLSCYQVELEFRGKSAHAAVSPDAGVNALDAIILTFSSLNAMRQHLRDDARIHGIITHGGDMPNVVPDYAAAQFYVRASDTAYTEVVFDRLIACAEGAARATGARLEYREYGPRYEARLPNRVLAELMAANMRALDLELTDWSTQRIRMGSSDIGNVSQVIPALHPYIDIGSPEVKASHTVEFREAAASPRAHVALLDAAKALAMTTIDLLSEPDLMDQVRQEFRVQKSR